MEKFCQGKPWSCNSGTELPLTRRLFDTNAFSLGKCNSQAGPCGLLERTGDLGLEESPCSVVSVESRETLLSLHFFTSKMKILIRSVIFSCFSFLGPSLAAVFPCGLDGLSGNMYQWPERKMEIVLGAFQMMVPHFPFRMTE